MKRSALLVCLVSLLVGQGCPPDNPTSFRGINGGEPAGTGIPELGGPVTIRVISESSIGASVVVRYLVTTFQVRRTELQVPALQTMAPIGPDLAAVVEISGRYATGGATPPLRLVIGQDFDDNDIRDYIIPDPLTLCPDGTPRGQCGCGVPEIDSDGDGVADCIDQCPNDPFKVLPGLCGCGEPDTDSDGDGTPDCFDACPNDPDKTEPGLCGCGIPDTDSSGNGIPDCLEQPVDFEDCNNNGIPDEEEIAAGDAQDCNGNGIPDECDIASGFSLDCNENGRPDECDIALGRTIEVVPELTASFTASVNESPLGGPVLIGGDDADDHGFSDGERNYSGWLYIEEGFNLIGPEVSNGNRLAVCLGCNRSQAEFAFAFGFDFSELPAAGWTRVSISGPAAIAAFFQNEGDVGISTAGIIYMPTDANNVHGGITAEEVAVLNANAEAINAFVDSGGGLFAHDQQFVSGGWGWLKALLPDLGVEQGWFCDDSTLNLTPAGQLAFPGLTDQIASSATPWHSYFSGDLGGLSVLVTGPCGETGHQPVILGGARVRLQRFIELGPAAAQNPMRTPHTVTAIISGDLAEAEVTFSVTAGPNAGVDGMAFTDGAGVAGFTYVGNGGEGTDEIVASFIDRGEIKFSNVVNKVWLGSADCNDNGIPDDCELDSDGNGIIDDCEELNAQ